MTGWEVPLTGVGYEALEAFLDSDRSPPESMLLSDLDGFLTGLAVGPALVMPSEWLPVVWGDDQPVFADEHETKAVLGGIFGRYNEILRQIEDETFQPILWADAEGRVIAADWAEGFAVALGLRPRAWMPLIKSKEDRLLLLPILALCGDENGESALGLDPETEDEVMAEAPALIPACVCGIAAFWQERKTRGRGLIQDITSVAARLPPKTGRNADCPCGSGKKFKKCCGSAC